MNSKNLTLIVILAAILILGGCGCGSYNSLVQQDESVKNSWNKVQSDYQRPADLIPNLVNTVKGEANFEQTTLTNVINARASATQVKVDPAEIFTYLYYSSHNTLLTNYSHVFFYTLIYSSVEGEII